jgi:hypothetical protein
MLQLQAPDALLHACLAQVRLLRRMLEWQEDLLGKDSEVQQQQSDASAPSQDTATGSASSGGEQAGGGHSQALPEAAAVRAGYAAEASALVQQQARQVSVVVMPAGEYAQVARGTTAGDIIRLKASTSSVPLTLAAAWYLDVNLLAAPCLPAVGRCAAWQMAGQQPHTPLCWYV